MEPDGGRGAGQRERCRTAVAEPVGEPDRDGGADSDDGGASAQAGSLSVEIVEHSGGAVVVPTAPTRVRPGPPTAPAGLTPNG
ncbi:hypothetical protein Pen02_17170 [Plantactinospora endophytica]|uniref:Uncharacterized protein n=1 Tax=Plantactinospora endophytica TaxID=673535 RepID=A0ABQ4DWE6_9ACTN|nr:hypothetical protein Pen02_17170 [Plantactinospora endophytica]